MPLQKVKQNMPLNIMMSFCIAACIMPTKCTGRNGEPTSDRVPPAHLGKLCWKCHAGFYKQYQQQKNKTGRGWIQYFA